MRVVIAFIHDEHGRLLITQRALDSDYGGYWELPGGKIEEKESPRQALIREIKEELGLSVKEAFLFSKIEHMVEFYLYHIQAYSGTMSLNAQQLASNWIFKNQINEYRFPQSNQQFFDAWFQYLEFDNCHLNHKT